MSSPRHTTLLHRTLHLTLLLAGLVVACARPFVPVTPQGFAELESDHTNYDYRAAHPDGIVTAVRIEPNAEGASLDFWSRAIANELRLGKGYALLKEEALTTRDGLPGKLLTFGHDEGKEPHLYRVALFLDSDELFLVEQGGKRAVMEAHLPDLDASLQAFHVRGGLGRFFSYGAD